MTVIKRAIVYNNSSEDLPKNVKPRKRKSRNGSKNQLRVTPRINLEGSKIVDKEDPDLIRTKDYVKSQRKQFTRESALPLNNINQNCENEQFPEYVDSLKQISSKSLRTNPRLDPRVDKNSRFDLRTYLGQKNEKELNIEQKPVYLEHNLNQGTSSNCLNTMNSNYYNRTNGNYDLNENSYNQTNNNYNHGMNSYDYDMHGVDVKSGQVLQYYDQRTNNQVQRASNYDSRINAQNYDSASNYDYDQTLKSEQNFDQQMNQNQKFDPRFNRNQIQYQPINRVENFYPRSNNQNSISQIETNQTFNSQINNDQNLSLPINRVQNHNHQHNTDINPGPQNQNCNQNMNMNYSSFSDNNFNNDKKINDYNNNSQAHRHSNFPLNQNLPNYYSNNYNNQSIVNKDSSYLHGESHSYGILKNNFDEIQNEYISGMPQNSYNPHMEQNLCVSGIKMNSYGHDFQQDPNKNFFQVKSSNQFSTCQPFFINDEKQNNYIHHSVKYEVQSESNNQAPIKRTRAGKMHRKKPKTDGQRPNEIEKQIPVCKFYLEGNCNRDNCIFRHDGQLNYRRELCKYYCINGSCLKGERCVYMHKDFPCKHYHLENKCRFSFKECRYSHDTLTDETRQLLLNHVERSLVKPSDSNLETKNDLKDDVKYKSEDIERCHSDVKSSKSESSSLLDDNEIVDSIQKVEVKPLIEPLDFIPLDSTNATKNNEVSNDCNLSNKKKLDNNDKLVNSRKDSSKNNIGRKNSLKSKIDAFRLAAQKRKLEHEEEYSFYPFDENGNVNFY